MSGALEALPVPIVLAPMAGGPGTPQLAAAVSNAGGLGFLASGYLRASALQEQIGRTRTLTSRPFGVNVFVPGTPAAKEVVTEYARALAADGRRAGVELGEPRFDDDDWAAKLALLTGDPVPVTSFTFGCPESAVVAELREAGSEVWVTVTTSAEAEQAAAAGADVLVVQGSEAGSHRGSFTNDADLSQDSGIGLLPLLQLVGARVRGPLVAAGGLGTGASVAAVLAAGASAAQLGTAFLRCPEAGTSAVHRTAVAGPGDTTVTRAFTGRPARAIRNQFVAEHSQAAPAAYPEVHYLTAPLRAAGRNAGNADLVNLWAGQAHQLSRELPAADLVAALASEADAALRAATDRLAGR